MKTPKRRALCSVATGVALLGGSFAIIPATATSAAAAHCEPFTYYTVSKLSGASYKTRGPVRSKYNSSSHSATLSISETTSTTRASAWSGEASVSVGWAIATVNAKTSYSVTKTAAKGVTVTDTMVVDSHKRGYAQPMVEYHNFGIYKWRQGGDCKQYPVKDMGILKGITSSEHWAECQTKSTDGCTPRP
ncbi:hypothetical protein [Streptomyces arenae]|uniref:hypothetical protein n=1 Tax=Streptomyces arenae TaxID=29301 RepID=UPI002657FAF5|nr:hypothetical protein [Streptomyces arenae]MCG7204970.1 hypothetical protein [Streptomyces arenae]